VPRALARMIANLAAQGEAHRRAAAPHEAGTLGGLEKAA